MVDHVGAEHRSHLPFEFSFLGKKISVWADVNGLSVWFQVDMVGDGARWG